LSKTQETEKIITQTIHFRTVGTTTPTTTEAIPTNGPGHLQPHQQEAHPHGQYVDWTL